jgi:large exoprotein involved in heme utilization and adhesion
LEKRFLLGISLVTGNRVSTLDGLLSANGLANVFLLNPNGVIFGANAQLNLGGSLVVSTGDRFLFNEGSFASQPTASTAPLLLVSAPIGVQMGATPGAITFQGNPALQLAPGRSLLLVGDNLEMNGGNVLAPGGRIELASITDNQTIGIQPAASPTGPTLSLAVPDTVRRSNVTLNGAQLTVNAPVGGTIALHADRLNINQSTLTAGVFGTGSPALPSRDIQISTTGDIRMNRSSIVSSVAADAVGQGGDILIGTRSLRGNLSLISSIALEHGSTGDITVNASGDVAMNGSGSFLAGTFGIINSVRPGGSGNSGNIQVNAENLRLNNQSGIYTGAAGQGNAGDITLTVGSFRATRGGFLGAGTEGQGNGGNITINARDAVVFDGESRSLFPSGMSTIVSPGAVGNAGNVTIRANTLQLSRGALFASGTSGRGNGANITINARDRITLFTRPDTETLSYISSTVERGAVGEGGTVRMRARSIFLQNPTAITTRTVGQGNGGDLLIRAEELTVRDGGTIFTSTFGPGQAGDLTVNVDDRLTLAGSNPAFIQRLAEGQVGRFGERFDGAGTVSGLFASGGAASTGQGGNLSVRAGTLVIEDGAQISVSSQGRGGAGNLAIATDSLRLNNASLQADT